MDFYERKQIPVLSYEAAPDGVERERIRRAICEKPFNVVSIEVGGKLYGIISRGDISRAKRAGRERVPVNTACTVLRGKNFMRAREIFREKPRIHEIPVTDNEGRLLGMCASNDDLLYLEYADAWEDNKYIYPFLRSFRETVTFVRAPEGDARRKNIIDRWVSEFEKCGVSCELIDFTELPEKQNGQTVVLIADEETANGAAAVIEALDSGLYRNDHVHTLRSFEGSMSEHAYDELIGALADSGVKIYNMFFSWDENTEGRHRLFEGMRNWLNQPGARDLNPYVLPSCAQDFYEELNTGDYAAEVGKLYFDMEINSIYSRMKDTKSRYLNIVNGERLTIDQPETAEKTIWCFGPCFILGGFVEDKYTIESILQQKLNREGYSCRVVNCGCYESPYQRMIHMTSTPMKPGDIVVMHLDNRTFPKTEPVDIMDILDEHNAPCGWFLDLPVHCNHKANQLFADDLYERMVRDGVLEGGTEQGDRRTMLSREKAVNSLYLDLHFNRFRLKEGETAGSIGMHGNPFTLGHRYLIETASKQVDHLFVLMIEDDLGIFSYAERFAMAVEGTKDLPNVRIVAGGPFQATRNVFQEYFVRVAPTDMKESAMADTLIFAEIIAKRLGITKRFLGDERHNPKMQFFNELMKETLPAYGIQVIELPRAQAGGRSISASLARTAAAEGDQETLLQNIPETTLKFFVGEE